MPLDNKMI